VPPVPPAPPAPPPPADALEDDDEEEEVEEDDDEAPPEEALDAAEVDDAVEGSLSSEQEQTPKTKPSATAQTAGTGRIIMG
jgi:hypothetical protein